MKLKVKMEQVLDAQNCWRMDVIPKLPQLGVKYRCKRCRPRDFLFLATRGMVSKNVSRMKKSKLEQHNTNAADEIFLVKEIITAV